MAKKQILIVDGDITFSERLKQNLIEQEYNVEVAHKGSDAIRVLEQKWVDLIISSIELQGGMNGIQLLREIKNHQSYHVIPVIIQTSKANMESIVNQLGARLFLAKPYAIPDLKKKIDEILQ